MARVESLVRPCKINYLVLRYRRVGKKSAAGLYLSPNKNKYNGKKKSAFKFSRLLSWIQSANLATSPTPMACEIY
jgi:hypothetical protein